jgi:hypothetical protein
MRTLAQLKRLIVLVLFVLPIACPALSQTPPSQWDTLPWKNYADFKLQLLNKAFVTTGILYDRVFPISQLDEHSGLPSSNSDTVTDERLSQAYYEIYNSSYNITGWKHPDTLDNLIKTKGDNDQHPIGIFFYKYNVLDSNSLQDHLLDTAANGQFRDVTGRSRSPYFTYTSFLASPLLAEDQVLEQGQHQFYFDSSFFLHNQNVTVKQVRIDFGDGQGEWIVDNPFGGGTTLRGSFINSITKSLAKTIVGRIIVVIIDVAGHTVEYGNPFKIFVKQTKVYQKLTACKGLQKWVINADPTALAQINAQYGNPQVDYKGRKDTAYFYFAGSGSSCNTGVLHKPIVFIDGFDPTNSRGVQQIYEDYINKRVTRNGDPNTLFGDYMLAQGYDFIILDFKHGNDLLERNALTLVKLLQQLYQVYGSGFQQDITLIGPSMGSLIAQYALAYMEHNNIPHHVKTYISFDGCHQGANVPIGLQNYVEYITKRGILKHIKSIREGLYNGLAARQMLAHHVSANSSTPAPDALRVKFLQNLTAVGEYPTQCRKVALINGANNGVLNPNQGSSTQLLNIYLKRKGWKSLWGLCGDNICKMFDWTCWTAPSSGKAKVAGMWTLSPLFNILFGVPPGNTNYYGTATWNNSALDNAPGGMFGTVFGTEPGNINESNLAFLLKETLYLLTGSHRSSFSQNLNNFTMMPSYSAADLRFTNKNLYMNWSRQYLCGNTPFDYVYAPSVNEQHVSVSAQGSQWFENEIKCDKSLLPIYDSRVISGPDYLCSNGSGFGLSTCKPIGNLIQWSVSPSNLVSMSPLDPNNNAVLLKPLGNSSQQITLTATLNYCGGPVTISKQISIATAPLPYTCSDVGNGVCTQFLNYCSYNGSLIRLSIPKTALAGTANWQWTVSGGTFQDGSTTMTVPYTITYNNVYANLSGTCSVTVRPVNGCGLTRTDEPFKWIIQTTANPCAMVTYSFMVSPNPASNTVYISSKEISDNTKLQSKNNNSKKISIVQIVDKLGKIKQQWKFGDNVTHATIDISQLTTDVYMIRIFDGTAWETQKLTVTH